MQIASQALHILVWTLWLSAIVMAVGIALELWLNRRILRNILIGLAIVTLGEGLLALAIISKYLPVALHHLAVAN